MWFISYNNSKNEYCYINKKFEHKLDAIKYIHSTVNKNVVSNIIIHNGDSSLITPILIEGAHLLVSQNNIITEYGIVQEITDYLVSIKKSNGDIVEFTKSRINIEIIQGRFIIN